jgi:hypothetical protein
MDGFAWGWPLGIMGVLWAGMSEEEARRALVRGLSAGVAAWLMWALVGFGFAYGGLGLWVEEPGFAALRRVYTLGADPQPLWSLMGLSGFLFRGVEGSPQAATLWGHAALAVLSAALLLGIGHGGFLSAHRRGGGGLAGRLPVAAGHPLGVGERMAQPPGAHPEPGSRSGGSGGVRCAVRPRRRGAPRAASPLGPADSAAGARFPPGAPPVAGRVGELVARWRLAGLAARGSPGSGPSDSGKLPAGPERHAGGDGRGPRGWGLHRLRRPGGGPP